MNGIYRYCGVGSLLGVERPLVAEPRAENKNLLIL